MTATLTARVNAIDAEIAGIKGEIKALREMLAGGVQEGKIDELLAKFDRLMDSLGDFAKPADPAGPPTPSPPA